jgi:hypothetical protein
MTAQEKAKELFDKIDTVKDQWGNYPMCFDTSKQCALIAVDQIILANPHSNPFNTEIFSTIDYWLDVKKELEKL